jgi:metallo-beta-lactamase class B
LPRAAILSALIVWAGLCATAQETATRRPDRAVPTKPFQIIGNIYYVGQTDNAEPGSDDASYLITTSEGHILLDSGEEGTVPQIRENVQKLGFRLEDIKLLIHSHAHSDHVAGDALVKELAPGVRLLAMEGDAEVITSGGKADFDAERSSFKPANVDRVLKDGEQIRLGSTTLVAHLTAGHTRGCTTWTTTVDDGGQKHDVVFLCSARPTARVPLVNNARYPNISKDYLNTFRTLKTFQPSVFLASHGFFFGMVEKFKRLEQGAKPNPFIDPAGYKAYIAQAEKDFLAELSKQGGTP